MGETEKADTPAVPAADPRERSAPGPADEARRALRAARKRAKDQQPPPDPAPEPPATPEPPAGSAPGEAAPADDVDPAVAAVPRTEVPSAEAERPERPERPVEAPRAEFSAGDPPAADVPSAGSGSRPGDIAREALRAARAQARQSESAAGNRPRAGRGAARGDGGARPRTAARATDARAAETRRHPAPRDPVAAERARAVRELLAGAFQMPSAETVEPADPEDETGGSVGNAAASGASSFAGAPSATPAWNAPSATPAGNAPSVDRPGSAPSATPPGSAPSGSPKGSGASPPPDAARAPVRSMAAPARDGDHRRTFPAFPPRAGEAFAGTWWGNAWVTALEEGALDAKRLARGRGYAEQGNVDAITVTPGLVLAYVQGSRPRPYRVQVRLRTLGAEDWERFLEAAVERPGHIAALLDKEMPESLAECGVPLLPGPGDLEPQCSCPDRGHPCKHAAALCYQTARLLDADPFVLLLLRGRGEREVLDALSRRNATRAARAAQEQEPEPLPGVRAAEALADRRLPPLPAPLPVPPHPEQPPAYPSVPDGPDSFALDHLATDAAARAHALLTTGQDEIGGLTLWRDAVRLAASRPGSGLTVTTRALYAALASAAGRTPVELARAVAAWRQGGPDGLTVLEETWDPPAGRFDRARPLLLAADLPAFRPRHNHLTHPRGHVQLRFGRDGLWYAYESEPGDEDWWPRGTPDPDPVGALTGLGGSDEL
ncbi:SWIM zinc finger family protein [Streptomyces maremycinicus]|uniref:SWIM zinc finger family protein n=1 Tax=Streptomyces maremycinicus TaxID=1679753 RepID=UPI00099C0922|nr:SWIM zinc finger family protein [Streptomyces sp. NBRC 110468]